MPSIENLLKEVEKFTNVKSNIDYFTLKLNQDLNASEMFEALGFTEKIELNEIMYTIYKNWGGQFGEIQIIFKASDNIEDIYYYIIDYDNALEIPQCWHIAINKQLKELGVKL